MDIRSVGSDDARCMKLGDDLAHLVFLLECNDVKGKVFPLQAQLWPRGWAEV